VRGRLLVFCGIPGSGKSTIAHMVARMSMPSVQLQTDGVRSMIAEPTYSAEESEFVYQACVAAAKVALDMGYLTILDGTFGSVRRREGTLSALEGHYSSASVVHVVCGLEEALQRNSKRRKPVPEENLRGILAKFDIPEGAITVDTSKIDAEEAARIVVQAIYPLVTPGSMTA
jgi:predicted kinase